MKLVPIGKLLRILQLQQQWIAISMTLKNILTWMGKENRPQKDHCTSDSDSNEDFDDSDNRSHAKVPSTSAFASSSKTKKTINQNKIKISVTYDSDDWENESLPLHWTRGKSKKTGSYFYSSDNKCETPTI
mmetsp:Transcript_16703/g.23808  ORF Transcript_16703/g.23808 Transcript_16703/m.23808 type:complete len:131 (-) Transcript_16703:568-960(-)